MVTVTREDVNTLKDDWLTDNTIAFWQEYISRERIPQAIPLLPHRPTPPLHGIYATNAGQPHSTPFRSPRLSSHHHIFLPINDNRNVSQAEGGSHWSLLLVSVIDGVAFHYDSLSPSNYEEANTTTYKLGQLLGRQLRFLNLQDTPQQQNGSDCGIYVCIIMRHLLLKRLLCANAREKVSMSMGGKLVDASGREKRC
ncbi:ulp1 protease family protein [Botrytis cinerea]